MSTKLERLLAAGLPKRECWRYGSSLDKDGYAMGWDRDAGKCDYVHRIAYKLCVGPLKSGYTIDHVRLKGCKHRDCVNWRHLQQVSTKANLRRSSRQITTVNAKKTRCPAGHRYTEENTYYTKQGWRQCIKCNYKRAAQWRAAKKAR